MLPKYLLDSLGIQTIDHQKLWVDFSRYQVHFVVKIKRCKILKQVFKNLFNDQIVYQITKKMKAEMSQRLTSAQLTIQVHDNYIIFATILV